MQYNSESLLNYLKQNLIEYGYTRHPPLYDIEQARAYRGDDVDAFAKNLFIQDRDHTMYLLTCSYHCHLDLKKVRSFLQSRRLSFVSEERLWELLGVKPGSVSPLALINAQGRDIRFLIDQTLAHFTYNYFHPLDNCITLSIQAKDWVPLIEKWGFNVEWTDFQQFEKSSSHL